MPVPYMTNVTLYSGVPWDNTYTDVRYFDGGNVSIPGQVLYNSGATYTYQRVNSSVEGGRPSYTMRVNRPAGELYNCNYLSFNNNDVSGGKTFYCFVNKVNYVAPDTTELVYEIDEFTTWFYDCTMHPCFVEREHAETDSVGDNTVFEPIGTFDMFNTELSSFFEGEIRYTALTSSDTPPSWIKDNGYFEPVPMAPGGVLGNVYQAYNMWSTTDSSAMNTFLTNYTGVYRAAGIIGVYTVKVMPDTTWSFSPPTTLQTETSTPYTPKNKKLLTAQFNKCILCASSGETIELAFEKFGGTGQCQVNIRNTVGIPRTVTAVPYYIENTPNYNYSIQTDASVESPYLVDNYTDYMARVKSNKMQALSVQASYDSFLGAFNVAASEGNSMQLISAYADPLIQRYIDEYKYNLNGNTIAPSFVRSTDDLTDFNLSRVGFWVNQKCVGNETAIQIDDFFDWYGYATMAPKQPNLTGRSLFNYVKTRGAMITGSIPADSMSAIKQMFNNGIRLWHTNNVGQYDPATGNPIG